MWLKLASQPRFLDFQPGILSAWLCGVLLFVAVAPVEAQTQKLTEIYHPNQALLSLSVTELAKPYTTESGAVLRVDHLGDLLRFTATRGSVVTHSNWYDVSRSPPQVVFGTADNRFHEVDNRVLVKLIEPKRLEAIAKEFNAVRAKRYPSLGYSVLWLRPSHNPIDVVKRLQADRRVEHAELQLKRPLAIPQ